ncbi:hypothetical protein TFLX_03018 [Thermoflexales bacterium]|nr:hypothetical protein TFLX_03018 [Thermoflexales bacterium]
MSESTPSPKLPANHHSTKPKVEPESHLTPSVAAQAESSSLLQDELLDVTPSNILRPAGSAILQPPGSGGLSSEPSAVLQRQHSTGNTTNAKPLTASGFSGRNFAKLPIRGAIQTKLTVGAAHDPYEEEADQVAEQVMRTPALAQAAPAAEEDEYPSGQHSPGKNEESVTKPPASSVTPTIQPATPFNEGVAKPVMTEEITVQSEPPLSSTDQKEEDREPKHTLATNKLKMGNGLEGRVAAMSNGGPLSRTAQSFTAPHFAADFSGIQVHANDEAADQPSGASQSQATRPPNKLVEQAVSPVSLTIATAQSPAGTQPLDSNLAAVDQSSGNPASQGQAESQDEVLLAHPLALEQATAESEVAELLPAQTAEQASPLPEDETKPAGSLTAAEGIDKEKSHLQAEEFPFQLVPGETTGAAIQTDQSAPTPIGADKQTIEPARTSTSFLASETETSPAPAATELPTGATPALNPLKPAAESAPQPLQEVSAPAAEALLPSQVVTEEDHIQRVESRPLDTTSGEEDETLRALSAGHQAGPISSDLEQRIQAMRSSGQPLPASERAFFEPRLGRDLSQVRVHADSEAAALSRQVSARAFTLGHDIAFGPGEYAPGSTAGRHLLAHELTHVVQQTGAPATQVQRAGPSNGAPATGEQPSLLDQLKAKLEALLDSIRGTADREASGIEGQANSEGMGVQGESQTRATGVESEAITRGAEVESQSTTTATSIESESATHTATTEGRSVADATKIEGEATTEATNVEGEATAQATNVQGEAASTGATLSSKGDAKIESEQSGIGGLEKKGQGAIETVQGEANANRNHLEGEADAATGELRGSYTAIETEAQGSQPDLLTQANALMGQLQSEARGTLEAAKPASGADLTPLEGDKAALEAKAQTLLAQLEGMLGPFFMNLATLWEKLKQIANAIWNRLKNQVTNAWEGLKNLGSSIWQGLQNGWAGLKNMASSAWQGLTTMANTVLSGLRTLATNLWNTLTGKVGGLVSGLKTMVTSAWTGLQTMASNIWTGLKGRASSAVTVVKNLATTAWNGLKDLATTTWSALQGRTNSAQNGVSGRKESAISSIQGMAGEFLNKIGGILGGLKSRAGAALNGLKNIVGGALAALKNRAGTAVTNLKARASTAVTALQSRSSDAITTFKSRAAAATATLKNRGLAAWTALKGRASTALATLKQTGSAAWAGLQNLWAGLKGHVQSAWGTIQSRASALWAAFQSKISAIWASLQGVWGKIKQMGSAAWAGLQGGWDNLKNRAQLMWAAIKGGWLGIVGRAKTLWGRAKGTSPEGWATVTQEAQQLSAARIQLKARGNGPGQTHDPLIIQRQLGEGQSLHASARSAMESAFGENLSGVQVHTDSTAVRLARQFDARAFTVGNHIAFDTGEYRPGTLIGDALIAHEVAHTIQQRGGAADTMAKGYEPAESAVELDADHAAIGAVASKWLGTKDMLSHLPQEVLPRLRTGLGLRRCGTTPKIRFDNVRNVGLLETIDDVNANVQDWNDSDYQGKNISLDVAGQSDQAGRASAEPQAITGGSDHALEVTGDAPTALGQSAQLELVGKFDGKEIPERSPKFSVVPPQVTIDEVNAPNTPPSVQRIPPNRDIAVAVQIQGWMSGMAPIEWSVTGDAAAGSATVNGANEHDMSASGSLTLRGVNQTTPGHADGLNLVAKMGNTEVATSNDFSIASYPRDWTDTRVADVNSGGALGIIVQDGWSSDGSGNINELDEVDISELVGLDQRDNPPFTSGGGTSTTSGTSGYLPGDQLTQDRHTYGRSSIDTSTVASGSYTIVYTQLSVFRCARTGINDQDMPGAGYTITHTVWWDAATSSWKHQTVKAGAATTVNGHSSSAGSGGGTSDVHDL